MFGSLTPSFRPAVSTQFFIRYSLLVAHLFAEKADDDGKTQESAADEHNLGAEIHTVLLTFLNVGRLLFPPAVMYAQFSACRENRPYTERMKRIQERNAGGAREKGSMPRIS